jgi:ribonuclease HI
LVSNPSTDGGNTRIPSFKKPGGVEVTENAEKSALLHGTFFPPPPENQETQYGEHTIYPDPIEPFQTVTDEQIARAIDHLKPYKASMPEDIANVVLKQCKGLLIPHVAPLYRATIALRVYPQHWKTYDTIVLRKMGRADYTIPKAYRPIVLLRTIAKPLSIAVAEDLGYLLEKHGLLPANHFGGRPGRATTDAIHLLVKYIRDAWRVGKVVSALFLDVKGAFPSVNVPLLIHELLLKGIPRQYTDWLSEKLTGRSTNICFDDYRSDAYEIMAGLDQGCPLSPLLYIVYNSPLVECPDPRSKHKEMATGFIDDVALLTRGDTFEETNRALEDMLHRPGGALEWAKRANCEFEVTKFALVGFSRRQIPRPFEPRRRQPAPRLSIKVGERVVKPSCTAKYLGVHLEQSLSWGTQTASALEKGTKWALACKRIAKPMMGIPARYAKRLYLAVGIPKMLYAADVWSAPIAPTANAERKIQRGQVGRLAKVHRQALLLLGALRTTATDILEAHADIIPFHLLLEVARHRALLRMATLPDTNPIHHHLRKAARIRVKRHPSPLHKLLNAYRHIKPNKMEKIQVVRRGPKWCPRMAIHIPSDKDEAKQLVESDQSEVRIFTDGSGHDKNIGAAALLLRRGAQPRKLLYYLGQEKQQTVYNAEVLGLVLGAQLLRTETRPLRTVSFNTDNQAAILATQLRRPAPGHYLMDVYHRIMEKLHNEHEDIECKVTWTPGHFGIQGNEEVDLLAKEAASGVSSRMGRLPVICRSALPLSKSAVKQRFMDRIKKRACKVWKGSPRFNRMARIDSSLPSRKFLDMTDNLSRRQTSMLLQMRTGHVPLYKYLHRIGKVQSPTCRACNRTQDETVFHVVVECPRYEAARDRLCRAVGTTNMLIQNLLTDAELTKDFLCFLQATGRFRHTQDDTTNHTSDNQGRTAIEAPTRLTTLDGYIQRRSNSQNANITRPWEGDGLLARSIQ